MATVLTLTANTLVDFLTEAPLEKGQVNRTSGFRAVAGGKGVNVGRVLALHGHRVLAAGFAGGWSGAWLDELVRADGMEPLLVPTMARTRMGFQVVEPEGQSTALLERGFAVAPDEVEQLVERVAARLPEVALALIGGSVPDARCERLFVEVVRLCHARGIPCWIDSYGPAMARALASDPPPALAKPNRAEYAADDFAACPEVHLTDGPNPVEVRAPEGRYRVWPPRIRERNPVGSGDCYLAGLAHARLAGWPLEEQLRYAAAAGAANAAAGTVGRVRPEEVLGLVAGVRVERLD
jgi:fructose-1-phosphate kinase PfkB-like protein